MSHYLFCSQVIASPLPLPGLAPAAGHPPVLTVRIAPDRPQGGRTFQHHWRTPGGEVTLAYRKTAAAHLLRFPALADFTISPACRRITAHPVPHTPPETLHHLLLDQVLPRCLAHRGFLMLHASAVCLPAGALLFLGPTGQGKSTLAGYFHRSGYPALSDDCVRLLEVSQTVHVIPTYGGLRLWPDALQALFPSPQPTDPMAHYTSKRRLPLAGSGPQPQAAAPSQGHPLLAVIVLAPQAGQPPASQPQLSQLPLRQAFIEMMRQAFLLEVTDNAQYTRLMQHLGQVVTRVPAYSLALPHDYQRLPQVQRAILDQVAPLSASQPPESPP